MTSISNVVEKVLKYCADNNILAGKDIQTLLIRSSSFIEENMSESFYGHGLRKYFVFIPTEIFVACFSGTVNKHAENSHQEDKTYLISFDELVKIWDGKIPYVKFYETPKRKFYYSQQTPYLSQVRVETRKQTYNGNEYYPHDVRIIDYRYKSFWEDINNQVKNKVENMRAEWRSRRNKPVEEEIVPLQEVKEIDL